MNIRTYLFGVKEKVGGISLTHNNVFDILRRIEGRWCRPFTEQRVGTVLFKDMDSGVYCRSLMKPTKINSMAVDVSINLGDVVRVSVRLPLSEVDASIEEHVNSMLVGLDVTARNITYKEMPFGSISFKHNGEIVNIPCADFKFNLYVGSLDGFKKVYLQGMGPYRECGCGMVIVRKNKE